MTSALTHVSFGLFLHTFLVSGRDPRNRNFGAARLGQFYDFSGPPQPFDTKFWVVFVLQKANRVIISDGSEKEARKRDQPAHFGFVYDPEIEIGGLCIEIGDYDGP